MTAIRVAVGQAAAVSGNIERNVATAARLAEEASKRGAAILLLPELFLCGYDLEGIGRDPAAYAIRPESEALAPLREACRQAGVNVVVGACLEVAVGQTNSALVIGRDGVTLSVYDKIHVWTTELPRFAPGNRHVLLDLAGFRVGLAICYDAGFPEHCRALALAGAELILCPSAFSPGAEERRYDLYFPMRALENTVYLAVANLVGRAGDQPFFGRSAVFAPDGALLAEAGSDEEVIVAEVSHDRLAAVRRMLRYLEHRRPETYRELAGEAIEDGFTTVSARGV
jgi:predicted amidohydrolase